MFVYTTSAYKSFKYLVEIKASSETYKNPCTWIVFYLLCQTCFYSAFQFQACLTVFCCVEIKLERSDLFSLAPEGSTYCFFFREK